MLIPLGFFGAGVNFDPAYELIATTYIGGPTQIVEISSIPQTYKSIQIRYTARTDRTYNSIQPKMRFNGSTANAYQQQTFYNSNNSDFSGTANYNTFLPGGTVPAGGQYSNFTYNVGIIDIVDYASTLKKKSLSINTSFAGASSSETYFVYGSFNSTAAISSISWDANVSTYFQAGSRFSLYGIKG